MKRFFAWLKKLLHEAVDAGICDFSGQGRDKYGK